MMTRLCSWFWHNNGHEYGNNYHTTEGGLRHRDSMGNEGVIQFGEVQVMSAGTGVEHSENECEQN
jgi:hypothetical protein